MLRFRSSTRRQPAPLRASFVSRQTASGIRRAAAAKHVEVTSLRRTCSEPLRPQAPNRNTEDEQPAPTVRLRFFGDRRIQARSAQVNGSRFPATAPCCCISPDVSVTLSDASLESPEAEARTAIRTPQEGCLTRASSSRRRLGVASPGVRFAKSNRAGRTGRGRGRIVAVAHHKINTAVAKGKQESAASCQAGLNPQRPRDVVSCSQSGGGW